MAARVDRVLSSTAVADAAQLRICIAVDQPRQQCQAAAARESLAVVSLAGIVETHRQNRRFSVNGVGASAQWGCCQVVRGGQLITAITVFPRFNVQTRAACNRACQQGGTTAAAHSHRAAACQTDVTAAGGARTAGFACIEHNGIDRAIARLDGLCHRQITVCFQIDRATCQRHRVAHGQVAARACDAGRDTAGARNVVGDRRVSRAHIVQ